MNKRTPAPGQAGVDPALVQLDSRADALRSELASIRRNIAGAQDLNEARTVHLEEANGQLVLAALRAETVAEEAVRNRDELARVAQRDALTDTPNRALLLDRLDNAIAMAQRHQSHTAVLFLDLDDFKPINDTYGHAAGDEVLRLVARRLESAVRHSDTVGRVGGDEFIVLLAEVAHAADAGLIAAKVLTAVAAPARIGKHTLHLSASIGVSICPEDGVEAATLISHADAAMYQSKRRGHGGFQFQSPTLCTGAVAYSPTKDMGRLFSASRDPTADHLRLRDLCEANEHLVIAAVTANEKEAKASESLRCQVEFQAIVAHELRGPLTPIRTAADLLKRLPPDAPLLGEVQTLIEKEVIHMSTLIDDLLDNSIAATGRFRLERENVSIGDILHDAVATWRLAMEQKGQHFRMNMSGHALTVYGDRLRLSQVFDNLLANASKYTPANGSIEVTVADFDQSVQVTIADTGMGITAAALPTIFDLFVQDRPALGIHAKGTGIGLAVVRDLVESHGGSVRARSAGENCGSEFSVTLPLIDLR
jgi:diguanylate cyclase (GGDEF)-like protein